MHWNHFLNRIRISGLKVFIVSLVFILILALALLLRTFTGKSEVDAFHFVAEMNEALSSGDPSAVGAYVQDGTRWEEQLASELTPFEEELQALTLQETRLQVIDYKTDRLRNQMDLTVKVETPDLNLLGRNWARDADTQDDVLAAYAKALKELPPASQQDLELLVDDVLAHVGSQARVVEVNKLAEALTKNFRSELDDLRPTLTAFNNRVSLAKPTKATSPKEAAGPVPLADSEEPEETTQENTNEPTTEWSTVEASITEPTSSTVAQTTPSSSRKFTRPNMNSPSMSPRATNSETTTVPTTRVLPAQEPTPQQTVAPTTTPTPITTPTPTTVPTPLVTAPPATVPTTTAPPQYPTIGHFYTVNSMNEDLMQIARQAYSAYANPEDYVYLIIEYNGLQIVDGQVVLYYGQTIYLPVP